MIMPDCSEKKVSAGTEFLSVRYFDIAWLSRYDGPGHRVVIFFQGCNLRCPWCHSPHSQDPESMLLFFSTRCLHCGRCMLVCRQAVHQVSAGEHRLSRERCVRCGKCIDACPVSAREKLSGALVLPTRQTTVSALWNLLYPQLDMVRDIGGLTVSGGEALLQSQPLADLLLLCKKEGIHTAVETSGAIPVQFIKNVVDYVDYWLYGLRPTPFYTAPLTNYIQENLHYLKSAGRPIIIRMPVVAGITDLPDSLDKITKVMHQNKLKEIQLLPFHSGTSHYYHALGRTCVIGNGAIPSTERVAELIAFFYQKDLKASVIQ